MGVSRPCRLKAVEVADGDGLTYSSWNDPPLSRDGLRIDLFDGISSVRSCYRRVRAFYLFIHLSTFGVLRRLNFFQFRNRHNPNRTTLQRTFIILPLSPPSAIPSHPANILPHPFPSSSAHLRSLPHAGIR
jgi:hypothetical protein